MSVQKWGIFFKIEECDNLTRRNTNNGFSFHEKTFRPHVSPTSRDYYVFRGLKFEHDNEIGENNHFRTGTS